jgi:hypothetical protein
MEKNIGKIDKWIRIVIGVVVLVIGMIYKSWWGLLGLIPIITAVVGVCPLYKLFKINTNKKKEDQAQPQQAKQP